MYHIYLFQVLLTVKNNNKWNKMYVHVYIYLHYFIK